MNKQERRKYECFLKSIENKNRELLIRGCGQCTGHDLSCRAYIPYTKAKNYGASLGRRYMIGGLNEELEA